MRKDSWSSEDDALLAKTVLDFITAGKTQLQAFEEAEKALGRTSAACGFRWNSEVRKGYEEELKQAKSEGRNNRKQGSVSDTQVQAVVITESKLSAVKTEPTGEADQLDTLLNAVHDVVAAFKAMQKDNEKLQREVSKLRKKLEDKPSSEDLEAMMKLFNKARELGLLDTDKGRAV